MLALPVPRVLGDRTLATGLACVAQLLADRPLEESLAALTAHSAVVTTYRDQFVVFKIC